jgi:hypothetical protein
MIDLQRYLVFRPSNTYPVSLQIYGLLEALPVTCITAKDPALISTTSVLAALFHGRLCVRPFRERPLDLGDASQSGTTSWWLLAAFVWAMYHQVSRTADQPQRLRYGGLLSAAAEAPNSSRS